MRTIVAVTATAILVSIVAVSTLGFTGNVDARTTGRTDSVAAGYVSGESAGSGIYTAVCGPDAAHACQTSS
jgi:hypothetical protein